MRLYSSFIVSRFRSWFLFSFLSSACVVAATGSFGGVILFLLGGGSLLANHDLVTARSQQGEVRLRFGYADFIRLTAIGGDVQSIAAWGPGEAFVESSGMSRKVRLCYASDDFLNSIMAGPGDSASSATRSGAIVTHDFLQQALGADVLDRTSTIRANGIVFPVVGVLPRDFDSVALGCEQGLFLPLDSQPAIEPSQSFLRSAGTYTKWIFLAIRRPVGVALRPVEQQLTSQWLVGMTRPNDGPETAELRSISYLGLSLLKQRRTSLLLIGIAVAVFGALGAVNLLLLALSYATAHSGEIAVRRALGASAKDLYKWTLARYALPALFGVFSGWLASLPLTRLFLSVIEGNENVGFLVPRWPVLLATSVMIVILGIAAAAVTWRTASAVSLDSLLRESADSIVGATRPGRMQTCLAAIQVGSCFLLLATAGSIAITFRSLKAISFGFDTKNLLIYELTKTGNGSKSRTELEVLEQRLNGDPSVRCSSGISSSPFSGEVMGSSLRALSGSGLHFIQTQVLSADPGVLCALGATILSGQGLERGRNDTAVLSETLAKRAWPGQSAVGKTFRLGNNTMTYNVSGVIQDLKLDNIRDSESALLILPFGATIPEASLLVRTVTSPSNAAPSVNHLLQASGIARPELIVDLAVNRVEKWMRPIASVRALLAAFSFLAMIYALAAIYGTVALIVRVREPEMGLRLALGGTTVQVLWRVSKTVRRIAIIGIVTGVVLFGLLSRALAAGLIASPVASFLNYVFAVGATVTAVALASGPLLISSLRKNPVALLRSL